MMNRKIKLSRHSEFSIEFERTKLGGDPNSTDMTIYRHGHGHSFSLTRDEMRELRNAITRELDDQGEAALEIIDEMELYE